MGIATAQCGLDLGAVETTLTVRRLLAFAAGIGDASAQVFDDLDSGFIAHPALCVALEWALIGNPAGAAALVSDPREARRAVHFSQDSLFHRPLRAGDRLRTAGRVSGIWGKPSGTRVATTLSTTDAAGTPAVTSHTVAVYRGVDSIGDDCLGDAPAVPAPDGREGEPQTVEIAVDRALPHRYSECAGIWNPIHSERRVALAAGLPDIVLHGTATWALAASELIRRVGGGDATRLKRLYGRFAALVIPDGALTLSYRLRHGADGTEVFFAVMTPQGEPAIAEGYALLAATPAPAAPGCATP
jgi:acyl dehydratase